MSEINDKEEIREGTYSINLKLIAKYLRTEFIITAKYKDGRYHKVFLVNKVIHILTLLRLRIR